MGGPRKTTSGSFSTAVPVNEAVEQLLQGTADISKLSSSENVIGVIVTTLGQLLKSDRENNKLKERISELEKKNEEQDRKIVDFELRLFKMEQYSSRSTVIITGVPANDNENTAEIVCKTINDADKDIAISPCDLSHCHRNWTNRTNRPPTITVVFNRSYDKDLVMRKSTRDKLKARRYNIHHHMGNTVLSTWGTQCCPHGEHSAVHMGNTVLSTWGTQCCPHGEHSAVHMGNTVLSTWGTQCCPHGEHSAVHMGNTVLSEFRRLSDRTDVNWVQYLCHRSNFSVKINNDDYIRHVLNSDDLDTKLLKLIQ